MENSAKKQAVDQVASLNEFLEQGNPIATKGLPKHQVILEGVIDSLSNLANSAQNSSESLTKAFDAMTQLNNRLEKTRSGSAQCSNETGSQPNKSPKR